MLMILHVRISSKRFQVKAENEILFQLIIRIWDRLKLNFSGFNLYNSTNEYSWEKYDSLKNIATQDVHIFKV